MPARVEREVDVSEPLHCWRCGASLAALSLPLARRDECPHCRAELHVCRMCSHYAPRLLRGCDEDDAPDVRDRASANFCDYFRPSPNAFDGAQHAAEAAARAELAKLFGDGAPADSEPRESAAPSNAPTSDPLADAEALFKR